MAKHLVRPTTEDIKNAYNHLLKSSASLSKARDAALGGRLLVSASTEKSFGVAGRSMAWKLFLCPNQPLNSPSEVPSGLSVEPWRSSRAAYVDLLLEKMRAPDGSYEEGLTIPGISSLPKPAGSSSGNLEKNNPLSLHNENPWNSWFTSVELRKTILQDVERTFPDLDYFRDSEIQSRLANILFVYSVEHPSLGYRQGMHELLAPILYAVDFDSISDAEPAGLDDPILAEICSRSWVEADAYTLFVTVMRGVGTWYEWREDESSLSARVQTYLSNGQVGIKSYVPPIAEVCNRIQSIFLKSVDPELWKRMQAAGIEPQLYGIRWLRLLFTREFDMTEAMVLWDGLFASDPTFELAQWICVAMILRIRNRLMSADYSGQLTCLLRYSTRGNDALSAGGSETPTSSRHMVLLLQQASRLQMTPSVATGASVVYENRSLLNIPVEVPDPPLPMRGPINERGKSPSSTDNGIRRAEHARHHSSNSMGLPELFARGLLDRSESLGINKVMNAVSEIKRNLPDLASSFILPTSPPPSFQLMNERAQEREGILLQRKLGDSVEWIVDTLQQDEDSPDQEKLKMVKDKKREALEALTYVRDILQGRTTVVDEEHLFDAEELSKRKARQEEVEEISHRRVKSVSPQGRVRGSPEPLSLRSVGNTSFMPLLNSGRPPSKPQSIPRNSLNRQSESSLWHRQSQVAQIRYPPPPADTGRTARPQDPLGVMPL